MTVTQYFFTVLYKSQVVGRPIPVEHSCAESGDLEGDIWVIYCLFETCR